MTTESHDEIHRLYQTITNRDMPCTMAMHFQWNMWKSKGWTSDDLVLVVNHIKGLIKEDRRRPESFRFMNLIGNVERFNEDLSEARAYARIPKRTPRQEVLEATGRTESVKDTSRTPAEVLASANAFAQFKAWRKESGI